MRVLTHPNTTRSKPHAGKKCVIIKHLSQTLHLQTSLIILKRPVAIAPLEITCRSGGPYRKTTQRLLLLVKVV